MKRNIGIISSLLFLSYPTSALANPPKSQVETISKCQTVDLDSASNTEIPKLLQSLTGQIIVRVSKNTGGNEGKETVGSGTILAKHKQGNSYLFVTNSDILLRGNDNEIQVTTHDNKTYSAQVVQQIKESDLTILKFESKDSYCIPDIISNTKINLNTPILAVGYNTSNKNKIEYDNGKIEEIISPRLKGGYEIGYNSCPENNGTTDNANNQPVGTKEGMIGGPIVITQGSLIGISGRSCHPISRGGFVYETGEDLPEEEIQRLNKFNLGIPIKTLLTKIYSRTRKEYEIVLPERTEKDYVNSLMEKLEKTIVGDIGEEAKKFTVRVNNGSGVIIDKKGDTYTVLTVKHNVCEIENLGNDKKCEKLLSQRTNYIHILGKKYTPINIKLLKGLDLAVVEFISSENYQVATLAGYPIEHKEYIFTAGYPLTEEAEQTGEAERSWLFTPGQIDKKERDLLVSQIKPEKLGSLRGVSQTIYSISKSGYELVYNNITLPGMSGGPVLDSQGRVIGIHGSAEGQGGIVEGQQIIGKSLGIPIGSFLNSEIQNELNLQPQREQTQLNLEEKDKLKNVIKELGDFDQPNENNAVGDLIQDGYQRWRYGALDKAINDFEEAIKLNDSEPDSKVDICQAYYGIGLVLYDQRKYPEALDQFEKAVSKSQQSGKCKSIVVVPALYHRSLIYRQLDQLDKSIEEIDRALAIIENSKIPSGKGLKDSQLQNKSKSTPYASTSVYNAGNLYNEKAIVLSELKQYKEAEQAIAKAIEIDPRDSSFYNNQGSIYSKQKKWKDAVNAFTEAIETNPKFAIAYGNRAESRYQLLQQTNENSLIDDSIKDLNNAIEYSSLPGEKRYFYNTLGLVYSQLGKWEDAQKEFTEAINLNSKEIKPESFFYKNSADTYAKQGKWKEAIDNYKKAIDQDRKNKDPENAETYYSLGFVYSKQGNRKESRESYNKAINLNPELKKTFYHKETGQWDVIVSPYPEGLFRRVRTSFNLDTKVPDVITKGNILSSTSTTGFFGTVTNPLTLPSTIGLKWEQWLNNDKYTSYSISILSSFQRQVVRDIGEVDPEFRYGFNLAINTLLSPDDYRNSKWIGTAQIGYQKVSNDPLNSISPSRRDELLKLTLGIQRDVRDNPLQPTKGSYFNLQVNPYIPIGDSNIFMAKLEGQFSQYWPVKLISEKPQTLVLDIKSGTTLGNPPVYEVFTLASSNSVYGSGGKNYVQTNAEYRISLFPAFYGGLFFNYGNTWGNVDNRSALIPFSGEDYGYGPLIQWIPISGVSLGLDYNIKSQEFFIRIGAGF
ncbi:MAG: tetratricopeptide repeat protein [Aphanizomenon flos-aquae KM1D3_PB]|uniref:tetratricopeptide repeat protein n=1 Tax=Aphanizomenon flos-aquae TaxID=1176 RepID=UPI000543D2C0|nr:tetratricopeptide repeat protein [Aphanizomenon flos-aquae]KHG40703.1 hypothetical protein OA07_15905 [Aphanizomenon flos-aquae 2012/KM1/D3]QSV69473.1 MAG: tetratricopeptide repeat protein [Aphanizomenon flos-aquae KM1D3_PB]